MSDCNIYRLMFGHDYIEKQYCHLATIHEISPQNLKILIKKRIDELKNQENKKYMSAIRCMAIIHGVDDNTMLKVVKDCIKQKCIEQKCIDEVIYI